LERLPAAEAIITISEFSKNEIVNLLDVDAARVYVTPLGVDNRFGPVGEGFRGLPRGYVLFLGNLEPRKNLPRLITGYRSLPQTLKRKHPLVIAGAAGWHTDEFERSLRSLREEERPILTGYVPQKLIPHLYRGASLFVYPSLYEGFGLPLLEAMASGVPVIASESTALQEVVGDAGVLVNPYEVDHLATAMKELLGDETKRQDMAAKAITRAGLFSWDKCARETLSVYENVLN